MTLSNAIFGSAVLMAAAIIFASINPAESQRRADGYMIASAGNNSQFVWRVNTTTGAVSYCIRKDNSLDREFIAQRPPYCSASTPAMQ